MAQPNITFITAVHNRHDLLQAMLDSLSQTVDLQAAEVILIDDASDPSAASELPHLAEDFLLLRNDTNLGFAASNNLAAAHATSDTLAFLNSDLVLQPGWLEPMLELLHGSENVGLVGNIQLNHRTGLIDHAGIFFDLEGMPTHARKNRRRLPSGDFRERNALTAACMLVRRSTFKQAKGFDTAYRNGMEDVDLCLRLKQAGMRHLVSHRSIVRHHVSASPGRHQHNDRNTEIYRQRWSAFARQLGQKEWPAAYLERYARHWWRMEPRKALLALALLARQHLSSQSAQPS